MRRSFLNYSRAFVRLSLFFSSLFLVIPVQTKAEIPFGVNVTVFDNSTPRNEYNNAPPLPPTTPIAGTYIASDVSDNFDANPVFNLWDDFVVKYEGNIRAPYSGFWYFCPSADDGAQLYINDVLVVNDWYDKGGGCSISPPIWFSEDTSQPFTLWFYENGGGAWIELFWFSDNTSWESVPSNAFTTQPVVTTTTTTSTTTTTTTSTTTTSTTTTTTTTVPPTTVPETTTTTVTPTTVVIPPTTTTTTTIAPPTTTVPPPTTTQPPVTTTTTIPVQETLPEQPNDQIELLVDEEAVLELEKEELQEFFESVDLETFTEEQKEEFIAAVSELPDSAKEVFEKTVNIYDGQFEEYVPAGSAVTVRTRKVLIAATGVLLSALPVSSTSGTTSSDNRSRRR